MGKEKGKRTKILLLLIALIIISVMDAFLGGFIGSIPFIGTIWNVLGNTGAEILQIFIAGWVISLSRKYLKVKI